MAFLDDLGKKISQTSQDVVQKTKDTAEILKLNSTISDEEKKLNNLYLQIGKIYYEKYKENPDDSLAALIDSVAQTQTRLYNLGEQVKRLKGMVSCQNCGAAVPYGAPFCSACGSKMNVHQQPLSNRCASCGTALSPDAAFCNVCGTKVEKNTAPDPAPEAKVCQNCGKRLSDTAKFCAGCGAKVE